MVLLLVWPGVWRWDDMWVAVNSKTMVFDGWQHILTIVFYALSYKILPFYSGVIIVQCVVISCVTSFIYNELLRKFKVRRLLHKVVLFLPFLLPPVIDNALYPLRAILYSYILLLLGYLMIDYSSLKFITRKKICLIVLLAIFAISWRSEGVYLFLVMLLFFVYVCYRKKIRLDTAIISFLVMIVSVFGISSFQNSSLSGYNQKRYKVSGTVELVAPLVRVAARDQRNDLLTEIDKVININYIIDNENLTGEQVFWMDGSVRDYSVEEYSAYLKTVIKLCIKYPDVVLSNRTRSFMKTSALVKNYSNTLGNTVRYYQDDGKAIVANFLDTGGELSKPWNPELRSVLISMMEGREFNDYSKTNLLYPLFWNLIIPFVGIFAFVIYFFHERKYTQALIIGSIVIKSAIVFMTAPGSLYMYYYPEYIEGYILLACLMIIFLKNREVRKKGKKSLV